VPDQGSSLEDFRPVDGDLRVAKEGVDPNQIAAVFD
jgi:hypothetical protein